MPGGKGDQWAGLQSQRCGLPAPAELCGNLACQSGSSCALTIHHLWALGCYRLVHKGSQMKS